MEDNKQIIKDSFDDIFSIPDEIETNDITDDVLKPKKEVKTRSVDYNKQRNSFQDKATRTIQSLLDFYLSEKIINEDDYIKQKANLECSTMSSLMNQIEISQHAINVLMENIDLGDLSPRMFEVLSDAQRTFIELIKMKSMHLIQMESSIKQLIADRDMYQKEKTEENNNQISTTVRGSKKLMQQIQDAIKNDEIQDIILDVD